MADFNLYYPKLVKHEGGYVNDPTDRGGETYRGIARKSNPTWSGWASIDNKKKAGAIKNNAVFPELESNVKAFYKKLYWDTLSLDNLQDQSIAEFLSDFKVNGMTKSAQSKIQSFVGANPDGAIGGDTIAQINKYPDKKKVHDYIYEVRKQHYDKIVANDSSQSKFLKGWKNRIDSFTYDVGKKVGEATESAKEVVKSHPIITISIVAGITILAYIVYKKFINKK